VVVKLREPLGLHIFERCRRDQREADQKHIGLRIGQRAQTVVVRLASSIPEAEVNPDGISVTSGMDGDL
jgi:hypothetical protein